MSDTVQKRNDTHLKSQEIVFVLTFFFGPLGLFYSSWLAAMILCVIAVVIVASGGSIISSIILCWPLAILIGLVTVGKHNEKVKDAAS